MSQPEATPEVAYPEPARAAHVHLQVTPDLQARFVMVGEDGAALSHDMPADLLLNALSEAVGVVYLPVAAMPTLRVDDSGWLVTPHGKLLVRASTSHDLALAQALDAVAVLTWLDEHRPAAA